MNTNGHKERPILFSGPMVRAILEGRKTQTRRVLKFQPNPDWTEIAVEYPHANNEPVATYRAFPNGGSARWAICGCPYGGPGDRLWVRETWATHFNQRFHDEHGLSAPDFLVDVETLEPCVVYAADQNFPMTINEEFVAEHNHVAWKSSIHMKRSASRITLEITNVRVERLQEISAGDCYAEGVKTVPSDQSAAFVPGTDIIQRGGTADERYIRAFAKGWDALNARRGYSWESNPLVWVIEFKVLLMLQGDGGGSPKKIGGMMRGTAVKPRFPRSEALSPIQSLVANCATR
ncbi:MAG TPA: hypothetical protein VFX97_17065 [Pyrinomonadaceae bacterium]|nr:hypothetical protein [Pyrinomonadaceae bacterium]